jgi:hypothetical protein
MSLHVSVCTVLRCFDGSKQTCQDCSGEIQHGTIWRVALNPIVLRFGAAMDSTPLMQFEADIVVQGVYIRAMLPTLCLNMPTCVCNACCACELSGYCRVRTCLHTSASFSESGSRQKTQHTATTPHPMPRRPTPSHHLQ